MSQIRSLINEATSFDPRDLTPADLAAEISEGLHALQLLEVAITGWVRSLSDDLGHRELGYPSPTAFLSHIGRMTPSRARSIVSMASAAEKAPRTFAAWSDGRLSTDQARPLFRAAAAVPEHFPNGEAQLVEIVEGLDAVDTAKAVEYWRQAADGPGEIDPERQHSRRGVSASWDMTGMLLVNACMTPAAGTAFLASLDANNPPRRDGDVRRPSQRRHDALENLCRDWLDNGATSNVGGEKPHISLLADPNALIGIAGGLHETIDGQIWDVDTLRMIACDCSVSRILIGADSEVLDVGRKTRVWSPAQRRAIIARDRHCQGPGCRAKPRHCDIHHLEHWTDGGPTSVANGTLLCRFHHTLEHFKERLRRRRRARTEG